MVYIIEAKKKNLEKKKERKYRERLMQLYPYAWRKMNIIDLDSIRNEKRKMLSYAQRKAGARVIA